MRAAIFDMDGTLLDSMAMWRSVLPNYFATLGLEGQEEIDRKCEKMTFVEAAAWLREEYHLQKTVQEIYDEMEENIYRQYCTTIEAKPYVREFLEHLRGRGIKMCVATLTSRYMAEAVLKRLDLLQYMEFILTVEEVGYNKDRPDIFYQCVKMLGCTVGECGVFEDSPYAMRTARNAGFHVCGIYDPANEYPPETETEYCDAFIRSFAELMEYKYKSEGKQ